MTVDQMGRVILPHTFIGWVSPHQVLSRVSTGGENVAMDTRERLGGC